MTLSLPKALRTAPFVAVILTIGLTMAAEAQTPMPDPLDDRSVRRLEKMEKVVRELRSIVYQGRDTGRPVVVQDAETPAQIEALTERVVSLEDSLQRLNAANENLTFELDQSKRALDLAQAENRSLNERLVALEQRVAAIEGTSGPGPEEEAAGVSEPQVDPAQDAANLFSRGRRLMSEGDYDGAETAFDTYVNRYGDTAQAPEARYWLGKTLTARGANGDAAAAYLGALRGWPKTTWAPDAVVELARALTAQRLNIDACQALAELPRRYPNASASVKARAQAARTQAGCAA